MMRTVALFVVLVLGSSLIVAGQTPTSTPTAQPSPTPMEVKDPEVKAFVEKINTILPMLDEGQKILQSGAPDSTAAAEAKVSAALELSRELYQRLDDKVFVARLAPANTKRAEYRAYIKMLELSALTWMSNLSQLSKKWEEKVGYDRRAVAVVREMLADAEIRSSKTFNQLAFTIKRAEVGHLLAMANMLDRPLNRLAEALDYGKQAVARARELQKEDEKAAAIGRFLEAEALAVVGLIYNHMDDDQSSIEYLKQSVSGFQTLPDQRHNVINKLTLISTMFSARLDYGNGLKYLNEALKIAEESGDKANQAQALSGIGAIYSSLGDEQKAHEALKRELAILLSADYSASVKQTSRLSLPQAHREVASDPALAAYGAELGELSRLNSVAFTYQLLEEYDKALEYYQKALQAARVAKQTNWTQTIISAIADTYAGKEDWPNAVHYRHQSLELTRQLPQQSLLARDLRNLSYTYLKMAKWQDALQNAIEALLIYQTLGADRENLQTGYATALNLIARSQEGLGRRRLAIFFGKQAVNGIQRERQQLKNLEQEAQRGYLKTNEGPYRRLAAWLITEGRIAEAEEVLAMLKEDELFNFLRRDDKVAKELLGRISLDDSERKVFRRYGEIADRITSIGKEISELEEESKRYEVGTFPRQSRLDELESQLADATKVFNRFFAELSAKYFNRESRQKDLRVAQISGTQALLARLKQPKTVIISTVVGEDQLNIIVTTAKVNRAHTVDIKAEALNRMVAEFRVAVRDPSVNPKPSSKQLYDTLFPAALKKDLAGVEADTIIWSLDGTLRYVPMAALWDGEKYLMERYSNALITLASRGTLNSLPANRQNLAILGMGVSKEAKIIDIDGETKTFPALNAVPDELCDIVDDVRKKEFCAQLTGHINGVIGGVNLLDEEFTLPAFKLHLIRYPIVHIASHFSLNPGNEANSYLLLGGGKDEERKLTLKAVRDEIGSRFNNVELLTLSACNTAMSAGAKSNGEELEGFGVIAQDQGAKSVLATLWAVADKSTQLLMSEFYRLLKENPQMNKAEALQRAQRAMAEGTLQSYKTDIRKRDTGEITDTGTNLQKYTHPYYWSPFVLIGNWR
jgi:CHAT domain-containing protein/tetratricopeptide (TPR) repeat protein